MDQKDFDEIMEAKLAEPEAEPEVEVEASEEPVEEVVSEGDDATESEPELILGKFKSVEDLANAFGELESKLGQQSDEVAEARRLREQFEYQQQYQGQQQGQPITGEVVSWFDELTETQPEQAAVWAMQNDPSGVLYNRALESWYEESPRAASNFERRLDRAQLEWQFQNQLQQQTAPFVESAYQVAREDVQRNFAQKHPDFDEIRHDMWRIAQDPESVAVLGRLDTTNPEELNGALDYLYAKAKAERGRAADNLATKASQVEQAQRAAEEDAKRKSQVASASSSGSQTEDLSPEQRIKAAILQEPAYRQY